MIHSKSMLQLSPVKLRQSVLLFSVALGIAVVDQITKALIVANIEEGDTVPDDGAFRLAHSTNEGSVFGLDIDSTFLLVMAPIVILVILWLYFYYLPPANRMLRTGLGLLLGGAIGNVVDRIRAGEVTDFLYVDLGFWPLDPWPTFNIADASITIGIFILIYCLFRETQRLKSSADS